MTVKGYRLSSRPAPSRISLGCVNTEDRHGIGGWEDKHLRLVQEHPELVCA